MSLNYFLIILSKTCPACSIFRKKVQGDLLKILKEKKVDHEILDFPSLNTTSIPNLNKSIEPYIIYFPSYIMVNKENYKKGKSLKVEVFNIEKKDGKMTRVPKHENNVEGILEWIDTLKKKSVSFVPRITNVTMFPWVENEDKKVEFIKKKDPPTKEGLSKIYKVGHVNDYKQL